MAEGHDDRLLPQQRARVRIDEMLVAAGWVVQDYKRVNLAAGTGVAVRELVTDAGPADYVLFVDKQAVGVIEAKKKGTTSGEPSLHLGVGDIGAGAPSTHWPRCGRTS